MAKLKDNLTAMLNAVTFAEAGEHEAAVTYLTRPPNTDEASAVKSSKKSLSKARPKIVDLAEAHLAAAAFAEAGEQNSALTMLNHAQHGRSVVFLVQENGFDRHAFSHALNLCKRLNAGMEILVLGDNPQDESAQSGATVIQAVTELARDAQSRGVSCEIFFTPGDGSRSFYRHLKQHTHVMAVVYGSTPMDASSSRSHSQKTLERIVDRLSIPLVQVLGKNHAGALP